MDNVYIFRHPMRDTWSRINFILVCSLEASSSVLQNKHTRHVTVWHQSGKGTLLPSCFTQ